MQQQIEPRYHPDRTCSICGSDHKVFIVNGKPECKECYDASVKKIHKWYLAGLLVLLLAWYIWSKL